MTAPSHAGRLPRWLAILLVSLAGLLLEVGYTRIVSFKLWYYYTYLVIGLSLLGIGSGGVLVAVWPRLRRASTDAIVALFSLAGAVSIAIGYLVIARIPINTVEIWDYGTASSFKNLGLLALICFLLFATFIAVGVIVATLLGRAGADVGRIYFADLVGAGLGCVLAIPLITRLGPPEVTALSALILTGVGIAAAVPRRALVACGSALAVLLAVAVVVDDVLPDVRVEERKWDPSGAVFSEWGPVFRVDVIQFEPGPTPENRLLLHDGTFGSGIWHFDGDIDAQTRFDTDPRSIPFDVLGEAPERELIIGSAGGNEILASLYRDAPHIEAVELNPVTVSLLTDHFADYTGHLPERPEVDMHQGDGRSYLARSDASYDLVWYVAPDSYAANNAASSGAFVLSESYLYTREMIQETLEHLTDDGVMVVQFGELHIRSSPNRTSRYIVTAREALEELGVENPSDHILLAAHTPPGTGALSTIIVKRTPFTPAEVEAFDTSIAGLPDHVAYWAPGRDYGDSQLSQLAGGSNEGVDALVASHPKDISAISDDAPFFWHFSPFTDVLAHILEPLDVRDPEDVIGERVLLLLLGLSVVYAALFLLLPFFVVRRQWARLPAKAISAVYFAALGLGFMFFEITMIQRLVQFLGYPTYSLTVTLASILVFTGLGALASRRFADRSRAVMPLLLAALAALTLFYRLGLDDVTDALLSGSLGARVLMAVLVLAPLGLCLGMFMPFGLALVGRLTDDGEQYVAWSWAVNGFFSVIGSVLTTILSMSWGFNTVQLLAFGIYVVAALAFTRLHRVADRQVVALDDVGDDETSVSPAAAAIAPV
jgi:hypothetical protein